MKPLLFLPVLLVALLLAGCGSSSAPKLAASDVAVVGSTHITQADFNDLLSQERASLKAAGQAFPTAGSTAYASLKTTIIDVLVQRAELAAEAIKLKVTVSDSEVQTQLDKLVKQYFKGNQTKYLAAIKKQGYTDAQVRSNLKEKLLEGKLSKVVTKTVNPTAAQISAYYTANAAQYTKPATRKVEEILVGKNKQALAGQILAQVKAGKSFAALAKQYSQDPGSKNSGGIFTATQGSDVPEFDAAVFSAAAKTGVPIAPVKTAAYGWFVIVPLAAIVPGSTTSESAAAPAIRKTLIQTQSQTALSTWLTGVSKSYCTGSKIAYQSGYTPSPDPCAAIAAGSTTTT